MSKIEVTLPDRINDDIDRLVDQGEFVNREQAVEELLSMGVSTYNVTEETTTEDEELFTQTVDDQDPAMQDEPNDDYGF
ncbi:ribbon-helix-helix domain-containing protein [Halomicrococcus sp. NG-SE-24]|uniref:ribbon-helix-helix domain-containing protein n=1 Tax=Halomicrococcus sp. NG-SE-24 TaxID=3436928 RepID=UPI000DDFEC6C|nr:CopG family transcriptional regulator [halophilic archaeon]